MKKRREAVPTKAKFAARVQSYFHFLAGGTANGYAAADAAAGTDGTTAGSGRDAASVCGNEDIFFNAAARWRDLHPMLSDRDP